MCASQQGRYPPARHHSQLVLALQDDVEYDCGLPVNRAEVFATQLQFLRQARHPTPDKEWQGCTASCCFAAHKEQEIVLMLLTDTTAVDELQHGVWCQLWLHGMDGWILLLGLLLNPYQVLERLPPVLRAPSG